MTRTELIEALSSEAGQDKKDTKQFLEALVTVVERTIKAGGEVPFKGLGKFKVQHRKARVGRNPLTGAEIQIPAKTVAKFTIAKTLNELAT